MKHILQKFAHDPDLIVPNDPQTTSFVRGLVDRGEAVPAEAWSSLPPAATHLIVGTTDNGAPILKRVRFSGFGR